MLQKFVPKSCKNLVLAVIAPLLLAHCGSTPKPKTPVSVSTTVESPIVLNGQDYIDKAELALQQQNVDLALEQLIAANSALLTEQNLVKSLWLAKQLLSLTSDTHQLELELIQLSALIKLQHFDLAEQLFRSILEKNSKQQLDSAQFYQLSEQIYQHRQQVVLALDAKMRAFALNNSANEQQVNAIWQQLQKLTDWQLANLVKHQPPFIKGWARLLTIQQQLLVAPNQVQNQLNNWQQAFPTHPANLVVANLQTQQALRLQPKNMAILLPLTGKQAAAGQALQQGMLAQLTQNNDVSLHFIDTNKLNFASLAAQFDQTHIDAVIGPLLKQNVNTYLRQDLQQITLLLNFPTSAPLKRSTYVLSMNPEDEAVQAAFQLSQKNFKHPLVLCHDDVTSKRIAQQFIAQWQQQTQKQPQLSLFTQGKAMQTALQQSMDITASKQRIRELNNRTKYKIKTETRNRRDIDMIYIIANAKQTRLIKPYIDVYTSPFAKIIPVYASSRSHSVVQDRKDIRDLTGLTMSEMPWLLPSKQQNKPLVNLTNRLWPNRNDSLQRIFAIGVDALPLLSSIPILTQFPAARFAGQTGKILLQGQVLKRSLLWGRYTTRRLKQVNL